MKQIKIGPTRRLNELTVFPLLDLDSKDPEIELLADALQAGTLEITELGGGTVPTLLAKNSGTMPVIALDGEQLIGQRQNRTTNRSILLAARSATEIPVSCMEHGRWSAPRGRGFASSKYHTPAKVRRKARDLEYRHAMAGRAPSPSALSGVQGEVWEEIGGLDAKFGSRSPTRALDDVFRSREDELDEWAAAFPVMDDQVGLLVLAGERPVGLDLVAGPTLYARLHPRLLRGYLLDALDAAVIGRYRRRPRAGHAWRKPKSELRRIAGGFLEQIDAAQRTQAPTVGAGKYTVLSGTAVGGELAEGEELRHLSAFPCRN